jgi:transcriptional regulator with XRE-family HTH domain
MPFVDKLKAIRDEKHLTNVEIARIADTPLATITRVFNGQTPNPTFETISRIAIAMGVSLDELTGLKPTDAPPVPSRIETALNSYSDILREKDDRIKELQEEKRLERKEKHRIMGVLVCFIGFVLLILAFDLLNGDLGYIRH